MNGNVVTYIFTSTLLLKKTTNKPTQQTMQFMYVPLKINNHTTINHNCIMLVSSLPSLNQHISYDKHGISVHNGNNRRISHSTGLQTLTVCAGLGWDPSRASWEIYEWRLVWSPRSTAVHVYYFLDPLNNINRSRRRHQECFKLCIHVSLYRVIQKACVKWKVA